MRYSRLEILLGLGDAPLGCLGFDKCRGAGAVPFDGRIDALVVCREARVFGKCFLVCAHILVEGNFEVGFLQTIIAMRQTCQRTRSEYNTRM